MKKWATMIAALALVLTMGVSGAFAGTFYGQLESVGANDLTVDPMYVAMSSINASWAGTKWFTVTGWSVDRKKVLLACLLTALSANKPIYFSSPDVSPTQPAITWIYTVRTAGTDTP